MHKRLLRRLPRHEPLFTATIDIGGRAFRAPKINGSMCDVSEQWMADLLGRLLPVKAGTFCDCGVNIGQTLLSVKAADPARRYIGFEPNPDCVAYVERLVALNRLADVLIVPVGLAEVSGLRKLQLYHGTTSDPSASMVADFRPGEPIEAIKVVPVMPFAEVAAALDIDEIGLIKIDVEGAEAEVMATMYAAMTAFKPWLIVEILPCYTATNVARLDRQRRIEAMLRTAGYAMFRVRKAPSGALAGLAAIEEIGVHGQLEMSDYVFCPLDDVPALAAAVAIESTPAP